MQKIDFALVKELKGVGKSSPLIPSPFLFSAIKGKKSTGSSILVSHLNELDDRQDHRKLIKKYLTTKPLTKEDIRRLSTHSIFKDNPKCFPSFSEMLLSAKKLKGCSDELMMLYGWFHDLFHGVDDKLEYSKFKNVLSELSNMERAFFQHRYVNEAERASFIMRYHLIPENFKITDINIREQLSLVEIIKTLNLFAYLSVCQGLGMSAFCFLKNSAPGEYTKQYWEELLTDSIYSHWTNVTESFEETYGYSLDPSDLRKWRRGKHFTTKFDQLASLLAPSNALKEAYIIAYCLDWHFKQLSQPLKKLVLKITMMERMESAQKRWDDLKFSLGA